MKKTILFPLITSIPMLMFAGGFQVNLQGNKQTGMGHLGSALKLGASSVYFNPGSMTFLDDKIGIEAGASFIMANVAFQSQNTGITERTDNPMGTPFYLHTNFKLGDKFAAGLSVYTPYGSTVDWGKDWSGSKLIQDISLRAIFIQPTISYQICDKLGLGAGLNIVSGSVELNKAVDAPFGDNSVNLKGSTIAYGFNAGLYYEPSENFSVGFTYRSQVDMELTEGDANFSVDPLLASNLPNTTFDATLPLPATWTLGLAYQINEKWLVSLEQSYIEWSAYKTLDFDFANATTPDSKNPRNYENSVIIRLGAQYSPSEKLDLRAGVYYDQSPVQDDYFSPETPNSNNIGMTAGLSFNPSEKFGIDVSYLFIYGLERDSRYVPENFGGKYASLTSIPGIGLHFNF